MVENGHSLVGSMHVTQYIPFTVISHHRRKLTWKQKLQRSSRHDAKVAKEYMKLELALTIVMTGELGYFLQKHSCIVPN